MTKKSICKNALIFIRDQYDFLPKYIKFNYFWLFNIGNEFTELIWALTSQISIIKYYPSRTLNLFFYMYIYMYIIYIYLYVDMTFLSKLKKINFHFPEVLFKFCFHITTHHPLKKFWIFIKNIQIFY